MTTEEFIEAARDNNPAEMAMRVRQYPEVDAAFALQQIEGWQKARTKLPTLCSIKGWIWPKRLSMEQCSSEETARYKCRLRGDVHAGADLTGGAGVDTYYLSEGLQEWHYVEQQEELCTIAAKNFETAGRQTITVHHDTAEAVIETLQHTGLIYLDPARRNDSGGKVFRLEDCTPDVGKMYPQLMSKCDRLMLKLSPMLDMTEALKHLPDAKEVHIVAVKNEVKELLVVAERGDATEPTIVATNLTGDKEETLRYRQSEEAAAVCEMASGKEQYLYEPNAAIMKAGAFRLAAKRYGLKKAATSTHLYLSDTLVEDFPGRIMRIESVIDKQTQKTLSGEKANVICRNHPLKAEELKKKLKLKDGGELYVIGFRLGDKPITVTAKRLK